MSKQEIDDYFAALNPDQRAALDDLRQTIMAIVPKAEECISYGIPAFRLHGKIFAGCAAYRQHLSYFPHSGSVLEALGGHLTKYSRSKGTLRFSVSEPLPEALVKELIAARLDEYSETE